MSYNEQSTLLTSVPALPDLLLAARSIADSLHPGRHHSSRRGSSTEFYDFRPYVRGDPVRLVDWRTLARSDRAYLRRFHHESQLSVTIILDASASMDFSGLPSAKVSSDAKTSPTKFRTAQIIAAAIALITVRQTDRVGLIVSHSRVDSGPDASIPPGAGQVTLRRVITAIEHASPQAPGADDSGAGVIKALADADAFTPRGGLVVMLTDGLDEPGPLLAAMARLRYGASRSRDVAMIQILAPDELDITRAGAMRMIDPETGRRVTTHASDTAAAYADAIRAQNDALRSGITRLGGRYALCLTRSSPLDALRAALE